MNRYLTSVYINQANTILAQIYATPKAGQVGALLTAADGQAAAALTADADAALRARNAYQSIIAAAVAVDLKIEPQAWQADYKSKGKSPKFVDEVDYQRNKP
jgi:hypothetical protein